MVEGGGQEKDIVLIVDDAPENIYVLDNILRPKYKVKAAIDGHTALRIAGVNPQPDIILLDIMMPGMDGYEVCRRIKSNPQTENIPVIFVTALGEIEDEQKGLELGACDYISKPFSPPIIKARIRNHLVLKKHQARLKNLVQERTRELEATQAATIQSMAVLAEYRDPETGGHIKRTQHYVRTLAEYLRSRGRYGTLLNDDSMELLFKSAPLHDIGKVAISDGILLKPGKLSAAEFEAMKKHTICGHDAISSTEKVLGNHSSFLHVAREIAYSHHEKWDGSGYPQGLAGEEIPLSGRIMAIADVYDALISKRVYKEPIPHQKAVGIIFEGNGRHFDPFLVEAFGEASEEFRQIAYEFADFEEERQALEAGKR